MTEPVGDPIRDYIVATRQTYTIESIRRHLLEAGHDPAAVDAALLELMAVPTAGTGGATSGSAPEVPSPVPGAPHEARDLRWAAAAWTLVLFIGAFLLLMLSDMPSRTYGVGLVILAGVLLVGGLVSLVVVGRNRSLARGLTVGILVGVLVPAIVAGAIVGLCVYTTAPSW